MQHSVIFGAEQNADLSYRIPALYTMPDGYVYAFCEARQSTGGDWDPMYLRMRPRTPDGVWLEPHDIAYNATGPVHNPAAFNVGDELHVLYGRDYNRFYHVCSSDHGASFSDPLDITYVFEEFRSKTANGPVDWHCIAVGPGGIARLNTGRIVVPVWLGGFYNPRQHSPCQTATIYSDDDGVTWHSGEILDMFEKAPSEAQIAALPQGAPHKVIMAIRNAGEERTRGFAWSDDGAHWGKPIFPNNVREINCQCSLVCLSDGRLITTGPEPAGEALARRERRNLTLHISDDWGQTWSNGRTLVNGISGYSALTQDMNGNVLCLYETWEDSARMRLELITIEI